MRSSQVRYLLRNLLLLVVASAGFYFSAVSLTHAGSYDESSVRTSKSCFPEDTFNFGVLIYNPYYRIYRSTGLGYDGLKALEAHLSKNELDFPRIILYMNKYGLEIPEVDNLKELRDGLSSVFQSAFSYIKSLFQSKPAYHVGSFAHEEVLAAQASKANPKAIAFDFLYGGNRDVYLNGRNPFKENLTSYEFADENGVEIYRSGGRSALYQILKEILTSETAVLFHCKGGKHRTGMIGMVLRYLQGGDWVNPEIPLPASNFSCETEEEEPFKPTNAVEYEYLQHNPKDCRLENFEAMRTLIQEPRFQCLKEKFSYYLNYPTDPHVECYSREAPIEHPMAPLNRMALWDECAKVDLPVSPEEEALLLTFKKRDYDLKKFPRS